MNAVADNYYHTKQLLIVTLIPVFSSFDMVCKCINVKKYNYLTTKNMYVIKWSYFS